MSTSFAALMAIGDANSRASQAAVKEALEARQKREAEQRRAREEKEAKEREREKQLRLKRMEEERRERERKEKLEAELKRKEEVGRLKEQEKMHAMLFGKKAAARIVGSKSGASGSKSTGSSSAKKDKGLDDDDDSPGLMLTREEIRARKNEMALKRQFQMSKRPAASSGFSKRGNRLPGGAVNVTINEEGAAAMLNDPAGGSIKDRLSKMPNYLTKLNTVKRDRRTEDEIQMAIRERKAKTLEGDEAKGFDAWFSSPGKKKDVPKKSATPELAPVTSSGSKGAASSSRVFTFSSI